eukprot:9033764-Ditylum_brightwellii.AAC.1
MECGDRAPCASLAFWWRKVSAWSMQRMPYASMLEFCSTLAESREDSQSSSGMHSSVIMISSPVVAEASREDRLPALTALALTGDSWLG